MQVGAKEELLLPQAYKSPQKSNCCSSLEEIRSSHRRALHASPDKSLQPQKMLNLVQACCLEDLRCDNVGIHVGSGATVLEITALLGLRLPGDADGRPAVCHAIAELVDRCCLVRACEAPLVPFAIPC